MHCLLNMLQMFIYLLFRRTYLYRYISYRKLSVSNGRYYSLSDRLLTFGGDEWSRRDSFPAHDNYIFRCVMLIVTFVT